MSIARPKSSWIFVAVIVSWCAICALGGAYVIDAYEPTAASCVALGAVMFAGTALPIEVARRKRSS